MLLLNRIWLPQSQMTNYFSPQQKLVSIVRNCAKVTKTYDTATTPCRRAIEHDSPTAQDTAILAATHAELNPAAIQRQIQALTAELLTVTTSKARAAIQPPHPSRCQARPLMSQDSRYARIVTAFAHTNHVLGL